VPEEPFHPCDQNNSLHAHQSPMSFTGMGVRWTKLTGGNPPHAVRNVAMGALLRGDLDPSAIYFYDVPVHGSVDRKGGVWQRIERNGEWHRYLITERDKLNKLVWSRCAVAELLVMHKCPLPLVFAKLPSVEEMTKLANPPSAMETPNELKGWTSFLREQRGEHVLEGVLQEMAMIPVEAYPKFFCEAYFQQFLINRDDFGPTYQTSMLAERVLWETFWPAPGAKSSTVKQQNCYRYQARAKRGPRFKYPWELCKPEVMKKLEDLGEPSEDDKDPNWKRQADLENYIQDWMAQREYYPVPSQIREHASSWLKHFRALQQAGN
jgi:hypothetical protein